MRILLAEDDALVAEGLTQSLVRHDFTVDHVFSAEQAETALQLEEFDAAIVDLGLPGKDGLQLIADLRRKKNLVPILVLTARDTLDACVAALDAGADDYLAKPFRTLEVLARLRVMIRRSYSQSTSLLQIGPLLLDQGRRAAVLDGKPMDLPQREWAILESLMMASPHIVNKERLLQKLTGWQSEITINAVEVYVSRLRHKLTPAGFVIRTIRGMGYRLEEPEQE